MGDNDGKVIIQVDTNADSAAKKMEQLNTAAKQQKQDLNLAKAALNAHNAEMKYLGKTSESMKAKQAILNEQFKRSQMQYANTRLELAKYDAEQKQVISNSGKIQSGAGGITNSLFTLKNAAIVAAGAFAAMKLTQFAGDIFKISSQFEQLNVAFEVLAGQSAGAQLVKDLTDLANVTPMTAQGLADNARLLLSFGEASENVISDLKLLGDISGGNQQKMDSLALAFAQAGSAGKLMGQDLLQMVNAGFNPLQVISEKTGKSMGELRKEMEKGNISFSQIKQAMIDATSEGGRFFGMMDKQSQTLEGRLSTLADKWGMVAKGIGDFFLPVAKSAVNILIKMGDGVLYLQSQLAKLDHPIQRASIGLQKLFGMQKQSSLVFTMKTDIPEKAQKASQAITKFQSGFRDSSMTVNSSTASHKTHATQIEKTKDAYEKLNEKISKMRQELLVMGAKGLNSGDIWNVKLKNYTTELQKLDAITKSIEIVPTVTPEQLGAFDQLSQKISKMQMDLQNMAVSGQAGTPAFDKLKNDYVEATNKMKDANRQVTNAMGLDWENISSSIKTDLASAITTPLSEGETAFQRMGNVALNIISMIGQKMVEQLLEEISLTQVLNGVKAIGKALSFGLFANGDVFSGGKHQAFASGGVVSSPTLFPMANGGTGLMGEAGAEAIMPLKRGSNGKLGVQASGSGSTVNVYNQSQSSIETVTRPNGDTDLFIRKVNNALANERTQQGLTVGMSRQNSRGVTAA